MFKHTEILECFDHVKQGTAPMGVCYTFSHPETGSDIFEVYVYGKAMNDYRFVIDNFPAQRKFYSCSIPYRNVEDFENDLNRISVLYKRKK